MMRARPGAGRLPQTPPATAGGVPGLLALYASADEPTRAAGRDWYPEQWRCCRRAARAHGVTPHRVAAILAACSPRVHFARAWLLTEAACAGYSVAHFRHCQDKVARVLAGERPLRVLAGPKVRAFYRNIVGDAHAVTVDVWAARAAGVDPPGTRAQYAEIEAMYATAARRVGEAPRDFQAIVWCQLRGKVN